MPKPSVWVSDSVVAMVVKHPGNRHSESPIAWNRNYLITNGNNLITKRNNLTTNRNNLTTNRNNWITNRKSNNK